MLMQSSGDNTGNNQIMDDLGLKALELLDFSHFKLSQKEIFRPKKTRDEKISSSKQTISFFTNMALPLVVNNSSALSGKNCSASK